MTTRPRGRTTIIIMAVALIFLTQDVTAQREPSAVVTSVDEARAELERSGERYRRILNSPSLSAGVYILEADAEDRQGPHNRDEVYYVLSGRALLVAGQDTLMARPGRALFVPAALPHRFIRIEEQLELLVFFGGSPG